MASLSYSRSSIHSIFEISEQHSLSTISTFQNINLVPRVLVLLTIGLEKNNALVKCKKGRNRLVVEKRFHLLVLAFIFISLISRERNPKYCGRALLWKKNPPYFQKTSGRIWLRYTAVSRRSFAHSQKNTHVVTRNYSNGPEYSGSGFGLFQNLPQPLRLTRVTEQDCRNMKNTLRPEAMLNIIFGLFLQLFPVLNVFFLSCVFHSSCL